MDWGRTFSPVRPWNRPAILRTVPDEYRSQSLKKAGYNGMDQVFVIILYGRSQQGLPLAGHKDIQVNGNLIAFVGLSDNPLEKNPAFVQQRGKKTE